MPSSESSEPLSLDRDLPTTAADVLAQRRLRRLPRIDLETYLAFLEALGPPLTTPRSRRALGGPPFDLDR